MSHNGLIGTIPSNIGNLKTLERLYLSQNQLVGPVPNSLGDLERLQRLALHLNSLNNLFPDIPSPKNLTFCRVQPNPFNGCPPNDRIRDRGTMAFQCHLDCSPKSINAMAASGSTIAANIPFIALSMLCLWTRVE
ncbi:hypothetical protein K7432_012578 [Basidiobolus ranarum]|uniref:Uncharacterized protein n=1 Tax=Basidiobolus ranarum TaxID=34480 RepID=A0ABR2WKP8_9FUNG